MPAAPRTISFSTVVKDRNAQVRVTEDGLLHAVELVVLVTGKNNDDASKSLRNLSETVFKSSKFIQRQISTRGGYPTKLITFEDAIELVMVLPGKMAKAYRQKFAEVIVRYLDGDLSMCTEIARNKEMGKVDSYLQFAQKITTEVLEDKTQKPSEMPPTSYVYATKTPAFPGLIKIGKTVNVANRLSQLNTSCAPAPHVIVAVAPTFDNDRDEKAAHTFFAGSRQEGEFFKISDEEAKNYFTLHIMAKYQMELAQNIAVLQGVFESAY